MLVGSPYRSHGVLHPQEKHRKAKWLSDEAWKIAEKRREVKEKDTYPTECRVPENNKER